MKAEQVSDSFDPSIFARLFELEDKHFWFRARNRIIATVMKRHKVTAGQDARILEIGCGNGNVLGYLSQVLGKEIWGADLFFDALKYCQDRVNVPLIQLDAYSLPFEGSLDTVCMFDVLEHLHGDTEILTKIHHALKPGGRILLTVPAYQKLWSYFDEFSHHQRRYEKAQLCRKLEAAGFELDMFSYYMMALLPLIAVGRKIQSFRGHAPTDMAETDISVIPIVNELLYWVCVVETWLLPHTRLPFGTSIILLGHKR